jgi:hypothetical protein
MDHLSQHHPEWEAKLVDGEIHLPSRHPTIATPLMVKDSMYLPVYWHRSYFYDFAMGNETHIQEIIAFLETFFREEIVYSLIMGANGGYSGGPISASQIPEWTALHPRIEIRSWLGTFDKVH